MKRLRKFIIEVNKMKYTKEETSICPHHSHEKEHNHGRKPIYFYLFGLVIYFIAFLMPMTTWLTNVLFTVTILFSGYHVILEGIEETILDTKKLKKFHPNVHILMTLAAIGACLIGDFNEGALLILIFSGAHFLEEYAEGKSRREITNLMRLNPTEARLIQADGKTKKVEVSTLNIGDHLKVLPGDQVPTDGILLEGRSAIDESPITGESMPNEKSNGDEVFGGTINGQATFTMKVTKESTETVFSKILQLVEESQSNLSKPATKIKKIEPIYAKIVLLIVPIFILVMPVLFDWSFQTSFYRGIVLLVTASPCALAASAVPATLSGISNLAKRGVLFKGGAYFSNLADSQVVAFDKTGTLTKGKPSVTDIYFLDDDKKEQWGNVIATMEKNANHPLAEALLQEFKQTEILPLEVTNKIGKGLVANQEDHYYQIGKPTLFRHFPMSIKEKKDAWEKEGKTVICFSDNDQVVAVIALMDVPDEKAKGVISYLKDQGIHTTMITGDSKHTGEAVCKQLNIDEVIGNVLPENKAEILSNLKNRYGTTIMIGDGINDAPALVEADIGFAMGEGTDVAMDVADAVIMQNDLTKFQYAHKLSKKLSRIVWENIIFAMAIVLLLSILNILGKMDIGIGVLAHEGSTLVVILNGLRLLRPLQLKE